MSISCATARRPRNLYRRLIHRHFAQIDRRSDDDHDRLCEVLAISFRPGNHTANFLGQTQRSLGTATLVALNYDRDIESGRRRMPILGLRGTASYDGTVTYGGAGNTLFHHDAALRPSLRSRREALNPQRNPSLTELAQRMDRTCYRQLGRLRWLPVIPQLPKIMLGFAQVSHRLMRTRRRCASWLRRNWTCQSINSEPTARCSWIAICTTFGIARFFIPAIRPIAPAVCS